MGTPASTKRLPNRLFGVFGIPQRSSRRHHAPRAKDGIQINTFAWSKNRDLLQERRHKPHKRRALPRPVVRRKSRSKNTTLGPRGLVPNISPRTSSDVVSGSPPLPKPTEVPPKYLLAMRALKTLSKRPIERFNASPSPRARPRRKASR